MKCLCVCVRNRFVLQDLMSLRDPRATLLWKDEGLPSLVQNSKYSAAPVRPPRPHVVKRPKSNIAVEGRRTSIASPEQ
ncbi:UNVERIFIED_CONTAM: hypothetical protein H355_006805 [Colinus virginianus]|nr:hypothetical protein H355_006805 [Colinus virginianus]